MNRFVAETLIKNGRLELNNIPFRDGAPVKAIIVPQADLSKMSFPEIWKTAQSIRRTISSEVSRERNER